MLETPLPLPKAVTVLLRPVARGGARQSRHALQLGDAPSPVVEGGGTPAARSDKTRLMTYPDRRPASTSVAHTHPARTANPIMLRGPPGAIPRTMSSARCNVRRRIESREATVNMTWFFI